MIWPLLLLGLSFAGLWWLRRRVAPKVAAAIKTLANGAMVAGLGLAIFWCLLRGQHILAALLAGVVLWPAVRLWLQYRVRTLPMDGLEARTLLGLGMRADRKAIIKAHRRRIGAAHPDRQQATDRAHGADLAARLNAARDHLLAQLPEA